MGDSGTSGRAMVAPPCGPLAHHDAETGDRGPIGLPPESEPQESEQQGIQPHGFLLAVRAADLTVMHASANVPEFLDVPAGAIVGERLAALQGEELQAAISAIACEPQPAATRLLTVPLPGIRHRRFHTTLHANEELVYLECEPCLEDSVAWLYGTRIEQAMERLRLAKTIEELCDLTAREIRSVFGFDEVAVRRCGAVASAEDNMPVDVSTALHDDGAFEWQYVPDAGCRRVPLLSAPGLPPSRRPDISFCALRAVPLEHLHALKKRDIRASLRFPLLHEPQGDGRQRPWGAVVCHHRSALWLAPELRSQCAMLGQIASAVLAGLLHRPSQAGVYFNDVDSLTQLPNRRVLLERLVRLQNDLQSAQASLIFLDIDRFKMVNDTLGHGAGDELLVQIASRLHACAGEKHLVARMGGDEFVVLCEDTPIGEATSIAKRIVENFQEPFLLNAKPFRCATSVGLAPMGGGLVGSVEDILHSADSAVDTAKRLGGNRFAIFEKQPREELMRQIYLEQDLFLAIEREEMRVYFQPQISIDSHKLIGFEALLRWVHPVHGNISPAEFVPMAERSGQIKPIGLWVMRESLRLIGKWRKRYLRELFVAVNVSGIQLAASDFAERVLGVLEETQMPPDALHLEVTESLLIEPSAEAQLCAIQELGVKIAIDDFGTGYSSLAYLQRLSVSELKLDSTFLSDVGRDERKTTLFRSIVSMAHTLQLTVIAEGVEDREQLQCIRECSCDAAQGYLFSKAISAESVEEMLFGEWARGTLSAGGKTSVPVSVPVVSPAVSAASNAGGR
jgi:diguanylate cyclase (GGDEF)-like protein